MAQLRHGEALLSEEELNEFRSKYVRGYATEPPPNNDLEISASVKEWYKGYLEQEAIALARSEHLRFIG
jgi:hypothetical protein